MDIWPRTLQKVTGGKLFTNISVPGTDAFAGDQNNVSGFETAQERHLALGGDTCK